MEVALLSSVNFVTGERPQGIDPRDPNLQSYGWQSLPSRQGPDIEIRVIEDDRSSDDYKNVNEVVLENGEKLENVSFSDIESEEISDMEGVIILEGVDEINRAIHKFISPIIENAPNMIDPDDGSVVVGDR